MNEAPKDVIFSMAKRMELPELLKFCSTNSKFNQICSENYIWLYKLEKDFPGEYSGSLSPKESYIILYKWKQDPQYPPNDLYLLEEHMVNFLRNIDFGEINGFSIHDMIVPFLNKKL